MAFELKNVVPWGRSLEEYIKMFNLADSDLNNRIISFGDGPASFNSEMTKLDKTVVSLDPIYQFTKAEIKQRIDETKETVIEQITTNKQNFVWKNIKNIDALEQIRMNAMSVFIDDFEHGKQQQRYIYHELPNPTKYESKEFDLGLSSHFLILYSQLELDFHIESINEMLRICKEIRIFPTLNLNSEKSEVLDSIIEHFKSDYEVNIISVDYEFQKNGNQMLQIKTNS
jgi:hypothetical protein